MEKQLRSLTCNFLWGGSEIEKKIAWVRWEEICKSESEGGLGVKNLLMFNKALLGKWIWRFLTEQNSLWRKIIKSKFGDLCWNRDGEERGEGTRRQVGWWKKVVEGVEGSEGQWFWDGIEQLIRDGKNTKF